jgi:hypothetical protein
MIAHQSKTRDVRMPGRSSFTHYIVVRHVPPIHPKPMPDARPQAEACEKIMYKNARPRPGRHARHAQYLRLACSDDIS